MWNTFNTQFCGSFSSAAFKASIQELLADTNSDGVIDNVEIGEIISNLSVEEKTEICDLQNEISSSSSNTNIQTILNTTILSSAAGCN